MEPLHEGVLGAGVQRHGGVGLVAGRRDDQHRGIGMAGADGPEGLQRPATVDRHDDRVGGRLGGGVGKVRGPRHGEPFFVRQLLGKGVVQADHQHGHGVWRQGIPPVGSRIIAPQTGWHPASGTDASTGTQRGAAASDRVARYPWSDPMSEPAHLPPPRPHGRVARVVVAITATIALLISAGSRLRHGGAGPRSAQRTDARTSTRRMASGAPTRATPGPVRERCLQLPAAGQRLRRASTRRRRPQFGNNATIGAGYNCRHDHAGPHRSEAAEGDRAVVPARPVGQHPRPRRGQDQLVVRLGGGIDGGGPSSSPQTIHDLTGLKVNHFLYVDLAGFEGVVQHARRRRHVHPRREREHPRLRRSGNRDRDPPRSTSARRATSSIRTPGST